MQSAPLQRELLMRLDLAILLRGVSFEEFASAYAAELRDTFTSPFTQHEFNQFKHTLDNGASIPLPQN